MGKHNKGAMEMSVGTIVTIVLLMSVLVLGLILVKSIFGGATENIKTIDDQVKNEISDLFGSGGNNVVVSLGSQNTAKIKQGTENFGIPIGYSPDDPSSWGSAKDQCFYTITARNDNNYCIKKGWPNVLNSIKTGTSKVEFDTVDALNGYALIKIDVPETAPMCLQRFDVLVECRNRDEPSVKTYFDVEVIKKGLF